MKRRVAVGRYVVCRLLAIFLLACGTPHLYAQSSTSLSILALGDSITYGQGATGGYEAPLSLALGSSNVDASFIGVNGVYGSSTLKSDGFSGYMINEIAGNLTGSASSYDGGSNSGGYWLTGGSPGPVTVAPNVILLMAGTNDINIGYDPTLSLNHPYAVNEDTIDFDNDMTSRLQTLIQDLRTDLPNTLILVASPPPSSLGNVVWNQRLAEFGPDIQTMISTNFSSNVDYVDMYSAFENSTVPDAPTSLILDGTHPDAAGYDLMAQNWDSAILADYNFDVDPAAVPEPSTYALVGGGLLALFAWRRFARR